MLAVQLSSTDAEKFTIAPQLPASESTIISAGQDPVVSVETTILSMII